MRKNTVKLVIAALCLALCMILPFLTGSIPTIGNMLSPMHLPVLLCGFVCGPLYGMLIGILAPLMRSLIWGMPPMFPTAVCMALELAAYGLFTGLLYRHLPKKTPYIYVSLIAAMLLGRIIWGISRAIIFGFGGSAFGWAAFISGAFTTAIPGIILQIILIPAIVMALRKSRLMYNE